MTLLSLNHYWRIFAAGLSYVVFGVGASLPGLYILLIAIVPMSRDAKQQKVRKAIQRLCRFYVNFMQLLGLFDFDLSQQNNAKAQGHLVIANHAMLIDALFILAYVDNLCCIVKSELCLNPFTRIPVKLAGYISNDSENLVELATHKLNQGENVLIFPEGTRNKDDLQLEFKRGAANIAIAAQAPILPIVIICTPRVVGKGESWYQLPEKKSKISIRFASPILVNKCIDLDRPRTVQYRHLTQWLKRYYYAEVNAQLNEIDRPLQAHS